MYAVMLILGFMPCRTNRTAADRITKKHQFQPCTVLDADIS